MKLIMKKLMSMITQILNNKVVLYILPIIFKKGGKLMLNSLLKKLLPSLLSSVMENEGIQNWFRDLGRQLGNEIPSDVAEPHIAKGMDLVKEGMLETVKND